ncbi:MAG: hypothetical protein JWN48_1366 [Myxococcaceae bacterium]|nr:hypothetical protein [Myxococcaceae bacterium]
MRAGRAISAAGDVAGRGAPAFARASTGASDGLSSNDIAFPYRSAFGLSNGERLARYLSSHGGHTRRARAEARARHVSEPWMRPGYVAEIMAPRRPAPRRRLRRPTKLRLSDRSHGAALALEPPSLRPDTSIVSLVLDLSTTNLPRRHLRDSQVLQSVIERSACCDVQCARRMRRSGRPRARRVCASVLARAAILREMSV